MRLEGKVKMGYYPTPAHLLPVVASFVAPAPEPLDTVLPAPSRDLRGRLIRFHRADRTDFEKVERTWRKGIRATRAWDDLWARLRRNEVEALRPAMPLKKGLVPEESEEGVSQWAESEEDVAEASLTL